MRHLYLGGRAQWRSARCQPDPFAPRLFSDAQFNGFGGEKMAAAGEKLLYPLANLAVMWFLNVFFNLMTFIRLIFMADRHFRDQSLMRWYLVDYPGLHWWIARRAKARGIPCFISCRPRSGRGPAGG